MSRFDSNLALKGDVNFQLELKRETKDSFKAERLAALFTKIEYAMVNENLVVVVFKLPR